MPNTRLDPEPQPHHGPGAIDLSRGHEHADIHLGGFIKFVAWLAVGSAVALAVCYITLFGLDRLETSERQSAAVRPFPRRDDNAKAEGAINSNENGEYSRRPTPLQPSPGHARTDWKDMDLLRDGENGELAEMGFRMRADSANLWIPRRVIPAPLVEAVAEFVRDMRATTRPATQPTAAGAAENGGGS
jgi:hypothetical protein